MIPTIVVSTGGPSGRKGKLASLPRTKYTSSPVPAPVQSVQISRFPVFCNSGVKGCTTTIRHPVIDGFLTVHQTLPTTRPKYMGLIQMHLVDNADDGVVNGSILAAFGHARAASGHRDHPLADTRAHGIHADHVAALVLAIRRDRLEDEQLITFETRVFAGGHHGAHHAGENHEVPRAGYLPAPCACVL